MKTTRASWETEGLVNTVQTFKSPCCPNCDSDKMKLTVSPRNIYDMIYVCPDCDNIYLRNNFQQIEDLLI